jgi:glutaminyl-peptide cyclotransferase
MERTLLRRSCPVVLALCACQQSAAPAKTFGPSAGTIAGFHDVAPVLRPTATATTTHDPTAFTQGLAFWRGRLFEGTGLYGHSVVHELDPRSGQELRRVSLPKELFGEGITVLGAKLYQLTWMEHRCLIYDADTLRLLGHMPYEGEGWGLANDGHLLIMSDGSQRIRFRDPVTMRIVRELEVTDNGRPLRSLNELEVVRGELWANVWQTNFIVRISLQTGKVTDKLDLSSIVSSSHRSNDPDDVLNGIAFDDQTGRLMVTGKRWPFMFDISVE